MRLDATPLQTFLGQPPCPRCATPGRPVGSVTLRALLRPARLGEIRDEAYRFCATRHCEVVYFTPDHDQVFLTGDLKVRVGLKANKAPRPLCYCFGHSLESLRKEWEERGEITAISDIQSRMKAEGCRCRTTNPAGTCCLEEVARVSAAIQTEGRDPGLRPTSDGLELPSGHPSDQISEAP